MATAQRRLLAVGALGVWCALAPATASGEMWLKTYDAASDTLPQAQGWSLYDTGGSPAPTVSGGVLHQGLTSYSKYQYWHSQDVVNDFSAPAPFVIEAELKVVQSTYEPDPYECGWWRTGYAIFATDHQGRTFILGIADTGVRLSTDGDWAAPGSTPFIPFDTTGAFHTYRLVVIAGVGHLLIDNDAVGSLPLGPLAQNPDNEVSFGDRTLSGRSQTDLRYV